MMFEGKLAMLSPRCLAGLEALFDCHKPYHTDMKWQENLLSLVAPSIFLYFLKSTGIFGQTWNYFFAGIFGFGIYGPFFRTGKWNT